MRTLQFVRRSILANLALVIGAVTLTVIVLCVAFVGLASFVMIFITMGSISPVAGTCNYFRLLPTGKQEELSTTD